MKKSYGMAFALLTLLAVTSCKSSKKVVDVQTDIETAQESNHTLSAEEWDGTWIILTAEQNAVVGEESVEITLDTKTGHVYGCDGCNIINGNVIFNSPKQIRFESLISTMKACGEDVTDQAVQRALYATRSYKVVEGNQLAVKFYDEKGVAVMSLVKRMTNPLNGAWEVTNINGKRVTDEELPTIVIDIQEKRMSGFAGCNRMFGEIILNNIPNGISFDQIATTRMACPDMITERDLVDALKQVTHFNFTNGNKTEATLYSKDGTALIELKKSAQ